MRSQAIGAGAPVLLPVLAGQGKIASMARTSTTPSPEIAIWMIWTRMSAWWKSCSFLLLPPPSLLAGTPPISVRTVARAAWRVPRWRLHQPRTPTAISPLRTLSTSHSCSSCNNNKLRILSRLLPQSLVSSESQPNNLPSPKHHNITTTHTSNLARMMSTNMVAGISDLLWSLHSMDRFRACLPRGAAYCELGRRRWPSFRSARPASGTTSLYTLQKAVGYPRTYAYEYLRSPQLLLDFCHLLLLDSQLIPTLYHHHLVLLRYTGSLGLSDLPPPPFSPLCYTSRRIVARLFPLVLLCLHVHFASSLNVVRCTCRFIHKRCLFPSSVPLYFPVRMWAGRFCAHDVSEI